ncbi:MAG TPA: DinB family protein [Mycobacteriales bacterium]|jgi:hypothetical protein
MEWDEARAVLHRTPAALRSMLDGLPDAWLRCGTADDWGPVEILGHLIEGEETDWVPRVRTVLRHGAAKAFEPFDRTAMLGAPPRPVPDLLDDLERLRARNLAEMAALPLDLAARGLHPDLGEVTLGELLATWAVHDLSHVAQLAERMARRWRAEIGPWRAYLPVVDREPLRD